MNFLRRKGREVKKRRGGHNWATHPNYCNSAQPQGAYDKTSVWYHCRWASAWCAQRRWLPWCSSRAEMCVRAVLVRRSCASAWRAALRWHPPRVPHLPLRPLPRRPCLPCPPPTNRSTPPTTITTAILTVCSIYSLTFSQCTINGPETTNLMSQIKIDLNK